MRKGGAGGLDSRSLYFYNPGYDAVINATIVIILGYTCTILYYTLPTVTAAHVQIVAILSIY